MPRGAKKDEPVTKLLYRNGILLDRGSFVSLNGNEPHLFLKGEDVVRQRNEVGRRCKGKCARCKTGLRISDGWVGVGYIFEMDHKQGGNSGRCDCLHNLQALCHDCHVKKTAESEHH